MELFLHINSNVTFYPRYIEYSISFSKSNQNILFIGGRKTVSKFKQIYFISQIYLIMAYLWRAKHKL